MDGQQKWSSDRADHQQSNFVTTAGLRANCLGIERGSDVLNHGMLSGNYSKKIILESSFQFNPEQYLQSFYKSAGEDLAMQVDHNIESINLDPSEIHWLTATGWSDLEFRYFLGGPVLPARHPLPSAEAHRVHARSGCRWVDVSKTSPRRKFN